MSNKAVTTEDGTSSIVVIDSTITMTDATASATEERLYGNHQLMSDAGSTIQSFMKYVLIGLGVGLGVVTLALFATSGRRNGHVLREPRIDRNSSSSSLDHL